MLSENSSATKDIRAIEQLARDLKKAYVKIIRKQEPGYGVNSASERRFLTELAHKVFAIGGKAVGYMQYHAEQGLYKNLYDVCSDPAVESYRQWIQEIFPLIRANEVVTRQLKVVVALFEAGHTFRSILLNPSIDINPIVCFCLAIADGQSDLSRQFEPDAAEFLKVYPAYRRSLLGDLFVEPQPSQSKSPACTPPMPNGRNCAT